MLRQFRPLRPGRKLKKGGDRTRLSPNWESKRRKMAFSECWPIDRLYVYKRSRVEGKVLEEEEAAAPGERKIPSSLAATLKWGGKAERSRNGPLLPPSPAANFLLWPCFPALLVFFFGRG